MYQGNLAEFITIAVAHLFAVASPGPDFAIVLRNSVALGKRAGLWTSLGIAAGILVHVTYCVLGLGLLLTRSDMFFGIMKLIAAIYLAYLGFGAIRASFVQENYDLNERASSNFSAKALVFTGFLTNGLNPKATLFFLALFAVVIDADTPLLIQAGYGIYLSLATFAWFALLSLLTGMERIRQSLLKVGFWFERIMGLILIALAVNLAFSLAVIK